MLQVAAILQALGDTSVADRSMNGQASVPTSKSQPGVELESALHKGSLRNLIGTSKEQLVEAERAFLTKAQALLQVCNWFSLGWYSTLPPPGTMFCSQSPEWTAIWQHNLTRQCNPDTHMPQCSMVGCVSTLNTQDSIRECMCSSRTEACQPVQSLLLTLDSCCVMQGHTCTTETTVCVENFVMLSAVQRDLYLTSMLRHPTNHPSFLSFYSGFILQ